MPERWQSEGDSRKLSDGSSDHPRPKRRAIVEPLVLEAAEYHLTHAAHHTSLSSPRIIAAAAAAANRRRSSEGSLANLQSRQKTAAVPANLSLTALSSLQQQLNGGTASVPRRSNNQLSKPQQLPAEYARTHYTTVDNTPLRHWSRAGHDENAGRPQSAKRSIRTPPARSTPLSTQNSGRRTSAFDIEHSAQPLPSPSRTAVAAAHGQHSPRTSPRARAIANPVLQWSCSSDTQQPQQQQRSPRLQQSSPRLSQQQQQQQRQRDSYYFNSSSDAHQSDSPAPERPPALRVRTTTTSSSGYERRGSGGSGGSAGSTGQRSSGRNHYAKHYSFTESEEDLAKQVN
jgi:hypothetical protein